MISFLQRILPRGERQTVRQARADNLDRRPRRQELVTIAVRGALREQGLPGTWLWAQTLPVTTRHRKSGTHVQLMMRDGCPELLPFALAFERKIRARIVHLDPLAPEWLEGFSWRFDLSTDASASLPPPEAWRSIRPADAAVDAPGEPDTSTLQPVVGAAGQPRTVLNQPDRHEWPDFSPTQPMGAPDARRGLNSSEPA